MVPVLFLSWEVDFDEDIYIYVYLQSYLNPTLSYA